MAYNKYQKVKYGLMPESYHEGDKKWINEQLGYLVEDDRKKVCKAYSKAFIEASEKEPVYHKKDGAGRFAANTRLRVFIEKRFAVFNK